MRAAMSTAVETRMRFKRARMWVLSDRPELHVNQTCQLNLFKDSASVVGRRE